jgi:hypothetical protein
MVGGGRCDVNVRFFVSSSIQPLNVPAVKSPEAGTLVLAIADAVWVWAAA